MEIQARIAGFVALGNHLMNPNNPSLEEVKQRAQSENAWFLPEFIEASIQQICPPIFNQGSGFEWIGPPLCILQIARSR